MLRGEPGIGKTALLDYLSASASGLAVVRAIGVQSELELPFASLHQLCAPLLANLERLSSPQRQALEIVFGRHDGDAPNLFLVGLAVLSLLAAAAEQAPLLCVVDDVQWLDHASASTLAFVTRRLHAAQVGIVLAGREPDNLFRHLPQLNVRGISPGEARTLSGTAVRFKIDAQVRDQFIAETRGNPLALLELAHEMTPLRLAGGFGVLSEQALSGRIERSFLRRLEALSDETRRLLLIAAAEPVGDPWLLLRASKLLSIPPAAAAAAEADGIVTIAHRVTFRHPLARSVVYWSATDEDRRAVHSALATATDSQTDSDRRAWHLAAAAAGPDEQVASELERSAGRAQARGGLAAAAAFLQRSFALTGDPAKRTERALAAAQANFESGAFGASLKLLAAAEVTIRDEFQQARADLLRSTVYFTSVRSSDAPALLLTAARRLEPFDLELARSTYLAAWGASLVAEQDGGPNAHVEICRAAQALPPPPDPARPLDLLLDGLVRVTTHGFAAATPILKRAVERFSDLSAKEMRTWSWIAATANSLLWDIEGMLATSTRESLLLRDAGALAALPTSLTTLAIATARTGDLAGAASLIAEKEDVEAVTGDQQPPYAAMWLLALQGREAETCRTITRALEMAAPGGRGFAVPWAHWTTAILCNGLGRYEKAAVAARQATSDPTYWWLLWLLPELIEAATRAGELEFARRGLEQLTRSTQSCGTDCALGIEARCRALLSDDATADGLYREAIGRLGSTPLCPDLARAHLLYGEWLRRECRRLDARKQLRTANRMLQEMGMAAFAERACTELQATGERVLKRTAQTRDKLTAQERQIARLACDELSNTEIGVRLFLSPRTVEWHLHNAFLKLGIRSRRELPGALTTLCPAPGLSAGTGDKGRLRALPGSPGA